jgi:hypothetical protein
VLKALARALRKTEEAYLDVADKMVGEFPELALMGSCVLAMLMKGEDMYLMNVGDSRAVLGTMDSVDLEQISEGSFDGLVGDCSPLLSAVQLTSEHSTSVREVIELLHSLVSLIDHSVTSVMIRSGSYSCMVCVYAGSLQNM